MKKNHSVIEAAIFGIGIGVPITLVCMTLIGGFNAVVSEFLVWTVASALFGILSVLIFSAEKLPLPAALALHCIGCLTIAVTACLLCGYASSVAEVLKSILPVFIIVYVLVFALVIGMMKLDEKKINKALEKE